MELLLTIVSPVSCGLNVLPCVLRPHQRSRKAGAAAVRVGIKNNNVNWFTKYAPNPVFTGSFHVGRAVLQCFLYFSFFVSFNHVTHFDVVEIADCNSTFVTRSDLFHIFLEPLERI